MYIALTMVNSYYNVAHDYMVNSYYSVALTMANS